MVRGTVTDFTLTTSELLFESVNKRRSLLNAHEQNSAPGSILCRRSQGSTADYLVLGSPLSQRLFSDQWYLITWWGDVGDTYYRHPSHREEIDQIVEERKVESTSPSPLTYYSTERYETREEAKEELALPRLHDCRVGPILPDQLPTPVIGPRRVQPDNGEPGGGEEIAVDGPAYVFGVADLSTLGDWNPDI